LPYEEFGDVDAIRALRNRKLEYFLPPFPCEATDTTLPAPAQGRASAYRNGTPMSPVRLAMVGRA
jgi:hypothetical protein